MPENRPPIPLEIQRQILYEAGHRCSACPERLVLEIAHIVPFTKSRDHSPENLICLCPNCHAIADYRGWDEKTFRLYKENPWIKRYGISSDGERAPQSHDPQDLVFVLKGQAANFDEVRKFTFQASVARLLNMDPDDVIIKDVRAGSIVVTVSLPHAKAWELFDAWNLQGDQLAIELQPEDLLGISMSDTPFHTRIMTGPPIHKRPSNSRKKPRIIYTRRTGPVLASLPFWVRLIYLISNYRLSVFKIRSIRTVHSLLHVALSLIAALTCCLYIFWFASKLTDSVLVKIGFIASVLFTLINAFCFIYEIIRSDFSNENKRPLVRRLNARTRTSDKEKKNDETTTAGKR